MTRNEALVKMSNFLNDSIEAINLTLEMLSEFNSDNFKKCDIELESIYMLFDSLKVSYNKLIEYETFSNVAVRMCAGSETTSCNLALIWARYNLAIHRLYKACKT